MWIADDGAKAEGSALRENTVTQLLIGLALLFSAIEESFAFL